MENDSQISRMIFLLIIGLLKDVGFKRCESQILEILGDLWKEQLRKDAATLVQIAMHNSRSQVTILDLQLHLNSKDQKFYELLDSDQETTRSRRVSKFVESKLSEIAVEPPSSNENLQLLDEVIKESGSEPSWSKDLKKLSLPPLPPTYTYRYTPVYSTHQKSVSEIRLKATDETRLAEQALCGLMKELEQFKHVESANKLDQVDKTWIESWQAMITEQVPPCRADGTGNWASIK